MALGRAAIVGTLLGGPMVLAFFSGGYFERPRLWALAVAWSLVALTAVVVPPAVAAHRPGVAGARRPRGSHCLDGALDHVEPGP